VRGIVVLGGLAVDHIPTEERISVRRHMSVEKDSLAVENLSRIVVVGAAAVRV